MTMVNINATLVVLALAIVTPFVLRALSSPIVFVLSLPVAIVVTVSLCCSSLIILGYLSDRYSQRPRSTLKEAVIPPGFSTPAAWEAISARTLWSHKSHDLGPLLPNMPNFSSKVNEILHLAVRDFILVWYKSISKSPSFPSAVTVMIHDGLGVIISRLADLDLTSLVVRRFLPHITDHVERFKQSEVALRGVGLERHLTQSDELDLLLASRYAGKGGKLHPAIDNLSTVYTRQSEEAHLRNIVEKVLLVVLPKTPSRGVFIIIREVLVCSILGPIMDMLADPDFWNRTIGDLAGAAIRQQKLISKVRNLLEAQSDYRNPTDRPAEVITFDTDARQFEYFVRSISHCDSLLDARRLNNDIIGEIRRTRSLLAEHEKDDWIGGHKTEDVVAFLDRLYTAKRKIEQRIGVLGGHDASISSRRTDAEAFSHYTLRDVLANPNSLSYFMEFMDRRGRLLLVQFWLTVESFKNPLESVETGLDSGHNQFPLNSDIATTLQEDISMVYSLYFAGPTIPSSLLAISPKHIDVICSHVRDSEAANADVIGVRKTIILAQREVEEDIDHDFSDFRKSDLWYRAISDLEFREQREDAQLSVSQRQGASSPSTVLLPSWVHGLASPVVSVPKSILDPGTGEIGGTSANSLQDSELAFAGDVKQSTSNKVNLDILISERPSEHLRVPLFSTSESLRRTGHALEEVDRMDAIQAALTDIIAKEGQSTIMAKESEGGRSQDTDSGIKEFKATGRRRRVIFDDAENEQSADEQEYHESEDPPLGTFQLAAPGDLQLSFEISRLTEKISHLEAQSTMLETLVRKAELTGNAQELKVLRRSKSTLGRELRQLKFQKSQYEQQDSANRLIPGRTRVAIVSSTVGDEDGKPVVRYLIEVQQLAPDGTFASGWVVARRYNEFFHMQQKLKERYLAAKNLDFPGKRLVTPLSGSLVDARRLALEKYLQQLLDIPIVCDSGELRSFLSRESPFRTNNILEAPSTSSFPGQRLVRSMYRTFTESIDDMLFGPSMLDVMIGRLTRQVAEFAGIVGSGVSDEDLVSQALKVSGKSTPEETLLHLPGDLKPMEGETSTSSFPAPICDLILAVFELDKKNNWLRRQAIVIILQQVLGDTIEKKMRETMKSYQDETHMLSLLNTLRTALWPDGQLKTSSTARTMEEKLRSKDEANRKLSTLIPDIAANMIGRSNARKGARRIFSVLQNRRLNQHILYTILDELFSLIAPLKPDLLLGDQKPNISFVTFVRM